MLQQLAHGIQEILRGNNADACSTDMRGIGPEGLAELIRDRVTPTPTRLANCVHENFMLQCRKQPLAPAVVAWDGELTYQELDRLSSRLAFRIAGTTKIVPDNVICVLVGKSVWVSVAILAILKAGAAFHLLDHSQPLERQMMICKKANTPLVLCSSRCLDRAQELGTPVLQVPDPTLLAGDDTTDEPCPSTQVGPRHAAYVIFSSGSSGDPKASVIEHAAIALHGIRRTCPPDSNAAALLGCFNLLRTHLPSPLLITSGI
ncbi:AMP-dependent synthetase/ligase [Penicillium majusculum]|nr:AMP-dependent synthetase/ligase [Penicillium majusculum]